MEKHADWYAMYPLTPENRNGYLAYLEQRLHLDADQEHEAARIEGHFIADMLPLYTAYQNAIAAALAARQTQVTTVQVTQPTIATPPVETTTTTVESTPPPQQVQVQNNAPKPQRRFIRNHDMK
jgi:hypothetical protein